MLKKTAGGKKDREKSLHHHLVDLRFRFGEPGRQNGRGDDGVVIGDLAVVEDPFVGADIFFSQRLLAKAPNSQPVWRCRRSL